MRSSLLVLQEAMPILKWERCRCPARSRSSLHLLRRSLQRQLAARRLEKLRQQHGALLDQLRPPSRLVQGCSLTQAERSAVLAQAKALFDLMDAEYENISAISVLLAKRISKVREKRRLEAALRRAEACNTLLPQASGGGDGSIDIRRKNSTAVLCKESADVGSGPEQGGQQQQQAREAENAYDRPGSMGAAHADWPPEPGEPDVEARNGQRRCQLWGSRRLGRPGQAAGIE
eukprot:scaffold1.g5375.t1